MIINSVLSSTLVNDDLLLGGWVPLHSSREMYYYLIFDEVSANRGTCFPCEDG